MKTVFYISLSSTLLMVSVHAGEMFSNIGADVYRDFASNQGVFQPGATDVPIYDTVTGEEIGRIPLVPNFGAVTSVFEGAEGGALAGGKQSWVSSARHLLSQEEVRFMEDSSLDESSPYFDSYSCVQTHMMGGSSLLTDFSVTRLSKVVTDAVGWDYKESITHADLRDNLVVRVGFGQQTLIPTTGGTAAELEKSTEHLTAGILEYSSLLSGYSMSSALPDGSADKFGVTYITYLNAAPSEENPLPIGALAGDSGSPVLMYDPNEEKWLYIGQIVTAGIPSGESYTSMSTTFSAEWSEAVQELYKVRFENADAGTYMVDRDDDTGMLTFTNDAKETTEVQALASGLRGDTREGGAGVKDATDEQLDATKDWVFNESVNIVINSNIDTGAGVLYFHTRDNGEATSYHLSATEKDRKLYTAGYLIQENVTVSSTLSGREGDEWRVVGDAGSGGNLLITHEGLKEEFKKDNSADLNIGVGVNVILDREGYYAANDVKISTGASVQLAQNEAISGSLTIGQDGGAFDLAGHVQTLKEINTYDENSLIISSAGDSHLKIVANTTEFKGSFLDSKSIILPDGSRVGEGVLNVSYKGTSADSSIVMSSKSSIAGAFNVEKAQLVLQGENAQLSAGSVNITDKASLKLAGGKMSGDLHLSGALIVEGAQTLEGVHLYDGHDIKFTNSSDTLAVKNLTLAADGGQRSYDQLYLSGEVTVQNVTVSVEELGVEGASVYSLLMSESQSVLTLETGLSGAHLEGGTELDLLLNEQMMSYMISLAGDFDSINIAGLSDDTDNISLSIGMLSDDGSVIRADDWQSMNFDGSANGLSIVGKDFGAYAPLPEPSTVTMSLLALTGLMMRRRRAV